MALKPVTFRALSTNFRMASHCEDVVDQHSIQLLVSNLHGVALVALVLQESKEGKSDDTEDDDVACRYYSAYGLDAIAPDAYRE